MDGMSRSNARWGRVVWIWLDFPPLQHKCILQSMQGCVHGLYRQRLDQSSHKKAAGCFGGEIAAVPICLYSKYSRWWACLPPGRCSRKRTISSAPPSSRETISTHRQAKGAGRWVLFQGPGSSVSGGPQRKKSGRAVAPPPRRLPVADARRTDQRDRDQ